MTVAEMERMTAEYDRHIPEKSIAPLTSEMAAVDYRWRRRGRLKKGRGAKRVNFTIDRPYPT